MCAVHNYEKIKMIIIGVKLIGRLVRPLVVCWGTNNQPYTTTLIPASALRAMGEPASVEQVCQARWLLGERLVVIILG